MAPAPPAATGARRDSFVKYAAKQLAVVQQRQHVDAPTAQSVRNRNGVWQRLSHATQLLGYAMCMSFFGLLSLIYMSSLQWTQSGGEDGSVSVLDDAAVLDGIWLPSWIAMTFGSWANIAQYTEYSDCGPKYAVVNLVSGVVATALYYGSYVLLSETGVDLKYSAGDVLLCTFWYIIFLFIEIPTRAKWAVNPSARKVSHSDN